MGNLSTGTSAEEATYEADAQALFFLHGAGHLLGLYVHGIEDLGEGRFGYADGGRCEGDKLGRRYLRLNRKLDDGSVRIRRHLNG